MNGEFEVHENKIEMDENNTGLTVQTAMSTTKNENVHHKLFQNDADYPII